MFSFMISVPVYNHDMSHVPNFVAYLWTKSKTNSLYLHVADSYHVLHVLRLLQEIVSQKKGGVTI